MFKFKKKVINIKLSYYKAREGIIDYKEYFSKYSVANNKYEMQKGCPQVLNIEGTYVLYAIVESLLTRNQKVDVFNDRIVKFSWLRDRDGNLL